MDLAAAQEETFQWKQAATKEAEARAVMLEEAERHEEEVLNILYMNSLKILIEVDIDQFLLVKVVFLPEDSVSEIFA
jgi:hypothetical protein